MGAEDQDKTFFYLYEGDSRRKLRFHDYDQIYTILGLYEQVIYERLKCISHKKVCEVLNSTIEQSCANLSER
jgi:hypothetical protein